MPVAMWPGQILFSLRLRLLSRSSSAHSDSASLLWDKHTRVLFAVVNAGACLPSTFSTLLLRNSFVALLWPTG